MALAFEYELLLHLLMRRSRFACYDVPGSYTLETTLCEKDPTTHVPLKLCEGGFICYNPLLARCNSTNVIELPANDKPVILKVADSTSGLNGKYLQASNGQIQVGGRGNAGVCPPSLTGDECPRSKNTVFQDDGQSLAVKIDGGQEIYVRTNGSLAFTQANTTVPATDVR